MCRVAASSEERGVGIETVSSCSFVASAYCVCAREVQRLLGDGGMLGGIIRKRGGAVVLEIQKIRGRIIAVLSRWLMGWWKKVESGGRCEGVEVWGWRGGAGKRWFGV